MVFQRSWSLESMTRGRAHKEEVSGEPEEKLLSGGSEKLLSVSLR